MLRGCTLATGCFCVHQTSALNTTNYINSTSLRIAGIIHTKIGWQLNQWKRAFHNKCTGFRRCCLKLLSHAWLLSVAYSYSNVPRAVAQTPQPANQAAVAHQEIRVLCLYDQPCVEVIWAEVSVCILCAVVVDMCIGSQTHLCVYTLLVEYSEHMHAVTLRIASDDSCI